MSHCHRPATEGAEFWISCKRLKLLRKAGRLQLIQNSAPSVTWWRQCDILIQLYSVKKDIVIDFRKGLAPFYVHCILVIHSTKKDRKSSVASLLAFLSSNMTALCAVSFKRWEKFHEMGAFKLLSYLLKSVNLQYITLGCLDNGTNESLTKRLMFQLLFLFILFIDFGQLYL